MIFVTVGTSMGDFKRLFAEIDRLVSAGVIDNVMAQTGNTRYVPKHYKYKHFITQSELYSYTQQANFILCHGGAGTLEECLGFKKKVIVVPRLTRYKEARDNHQIEIARMLSDLNRVLMVMDIKDLEKQVNYIKTWTPEFSENDGKERIIHTINEFIENTQRVLSGLSS